MSRSYENHIENPEAYRAAVDARIKANARKGRQQRWYAADPSREALIVALKEHVGIIPPADIAAFRSRVWDDGGDDFDYTPAEQRRFREWQNRYVSPFLGKMHDSFEEWGSLTEGQERAVREQLAKGEAIKAERAEKRQAQAEADKTSVHVGTIGKREVFTLTLRSHFSTETMYGCMEIYTFTDAAGNVLVYKGSGELKVERGQTITLKATVKAHSEYNGTQQTLLARPKMEKAQ